MISFWIFAALMMLLGLGLLLPSILGKGRMSAAGERDALNVAIFKDRMQELEDELALASLTQEQFDAARSELERDLLQNAGDDAPAQASTMEGRWTALVLIIAIPLVAVLLYFKLGMPDAIEWTPAQQHAEQGNAQGMQGLDSMVVQLRERLKASPEDVEGWMLLGRSLSILERYDEANQAYAKAHELSGDVPALLAEYAESLAMASPQGLNGKPIELLRKALAVDPNEPRALWLAGIYAFEEKSFQQAIELWSRLEAQLGTDPESLTMVQSALQNARAQLGLPAMAPAAPVPEAGSNTAVSDASVTVKVELGAGMAEKVQPGDTLFVMARPVGGRMPVAIVRHQATELPITVTLDDSKSLMPTNKLSDFEQVDLVARVSKSGNAMPAPGDLEGQITATVNDDKVFSITIDREF